MYEFDWDEYNVDHIARHEAEPEEAEDVFEERPFIRRSRDGRYLAFGRTAAGRLLIVVFEGSPGGGLIRVVTARDMTRAEEALYRRRGK